MRYSSLESAYLNLYLCTVSYKIAQDEDVGNTVFSQLMSFVLDYGLWKCINRNRGEFHSGQFTCRAPFLVMNYAQFTISAISRSIETQLIVFNFKLYHAGLIVMSKSTLADVNEKKA